MPMKRAIVLGISLLVALTQADEWRMPPSARYSPDGKFMLASKREPTHPTLTLKQRSTNGWTTLWSISSPQTSDPYLVHFEPDGGVVLHDEWGQLGYGVVLAFINSRGQVQKSYALKDFLPQSDILHSQITISSIWWTQRGKVGFTNHGTEFSVVTAGRTFRCFDLKTGRMKPMTESLRESIRKEFIAETRTNLGSPDKSIRREAAETCCALQDVESLPILRKFLDDPAQNQTRYLQNPLVPDGTYEDNPVQLAAAYSLLQLDPKQTIPIIEARIKNSNAAMSYNWAETLAEARLAGADAVWKRLAADRNPRLSRLGTAFAKSSAARS
jgi:hypothetical protein